MTQGGTPAGVGIPLLLDYLYWLRDRVLATAAELDAETFLATPAIHDRDLRATLAHELDVELSWRAKLRGEPPSAWGPEAEVKPDRFPTVADLAEAWAADEAVMRDWIGGLSAGELEQPVTANGLEGYALEIYLMHVIEHGVTEFTSAAAILGQLGRSTGDLGVLNLLDDIAPMPVART
jgi:uncharacterized damage-inducible protein DinB